MQIYSNGKDRVLTGKFPAKFKLRKDGIDVPFIRTGADSVRLSGEVPEGDLDVLEVIREIAKPQNSLMTDLRFAMINESEVDRIEKLSQTLEEKGNAFEKKGEILEKHAKSLLEKEDKNTVAIKETNTRIENMARAVGKEIQADRDALNATSESIKQVVSERVEVLDAKLQAHEVAKNPHKITKSTIGLDAVDNTSDADKPISKATKKALDKKADKTAIEELDKKIEEAGKKQESFQKTIENANLYGGVGGDIIRGGNIGQILSKASNMDGDYKWVDAESGIEIIRVDELPAEGKTSVLYLVPSTDPESDNIYDEYIWAIQDDDSYAWEKIGTTEVDLSGYIKGVQINGTDLTPDANNKVNIPKAVSGQETLGVVKAKDAGYGVTVRSDGQLTTNPGDWAKYNNATTAPNSWLPIVTKDLLLGMKAFLGTIITGSTSNLTWNDTEKTAARNTLGAEAQATIQTLSATDSITLADNTIYNGGEQTALTITLPATVNVSFLCEIDFTSGATPATLSYPNTIKWVGDDVSSNVFVPVASKRYTIICAYDGVNYRATVKGV